MTRTRASRLASLLVALSAAACAAPGGTIPAPAPRPEATTLLPFASERELAEFSRVLGREARKHDRWLRSAPPPPPPVSAPGAESITNVQEAGVDEGGIVKVHGDHLVVLRRGRLFTVRMGGDALQPVAAVDAFGPGIDPGHSWYDEMLVTGDHVVVVGYSYARGGTELGLFRIGADGSLAHRATYNLRGADYYSPTNYASRLLGDRLVFYAPIPVTGDVRKSLPAIRRWNGGGWVRTVTPGRLYRPAGELSVQTGVVVHAVTSCGVENDELRCESTAFFGPEGHEFYVSPRAVYVWAGRFGGWDDQRQPPAVLFRMPLDGGAPTGLRVSGEPLDQLSFLESADEHLNVLTRMDTYTLRDVWREQAAPNAVALLRVPLSALSDGDDTAGREMYRLLPTPDGSLQNRYVGDWLLYGAGAGWGAPRPGPHTAYALRWAGGGEVAALTVPHGIDRIEALDGHAVLVGGDGGALHFTSVRLDPSAARVAERFTRPGASQGETRTHGFFYRPDGGGAGMLGLPLRGAARPGYEHLGRGSISILFLRNRGLRLEDAGELDARPPALERDACRASCVDWYGNARPIFLRGRVFALMGYELVEGAMQDGRVREVRRVSFAPRVPPAQVGGEWTFTETIGYPGSRYYCASQGTMRFDQREASLAMTYRQTGECTIGGATASSAGEGSGSGMVAGSDLLLEVDACRNVGTVRPAGDIEGWLTCGVTLPGGEQATVSGRWTARRASPP